MLSVGIHKDLNEYKPKVFGSLSGRSLGFCITALVIGLLVGCWFVFVLGIDMMITSYVVIAVTLPFWACGFWRPKGMNAEDFVPMWIKHRLSDGKLYYKSTNYIDFAFNKNFHRIGSEKVEVDKSYQKFVKHNGIEKIKYEF